MANGLSVVWGWSDKDERKITKKANQDGKLTEWYENGQIMLGGK